MTMLPEAEGLSQHQLVQDIVHTARHTASIKYSSSTLPGGDLAEIRLEGDYPLVSAEGFFGATLLRTISMDKVSPRFRGGEFRILTNEALGNLHDAYSSHLDVIVDATPHFLKELSDTQVQEHLAQARGQVMHNEHPAALIQNRASDVHDGEYRSRPDGQLDLQEEVWFAKALNVMHMFPGMTVQTAKQILSHLGEQPFLSDYGLGVTTLLSQRYNGQAPTDMTIKVIEGDQFIAPFGDQSLVDFDVTHIVGQQGDVIRAYLSQQMSSCQELVHLPNGRRFMGSVLANYPIMQDNVEFEAQLVAIEEQDTSVFHTFRILRHGNMKDAYVRIDSICANGVQGGDTHCDCRKQSETEKERAGKGDSMILINIRDHEGRAHGEGLKGGTLMVQREINELIHQGSLPNQNEDIGNGTAAQLFYHDTGDMVDARDYTTTQALLCYLHIDYIPCLVTDNLAKIQAVEAVSSIGKLTTAEVVEGLSREAQRLYDDKREDNIPGVIYRFEDHL